MANDGQTKFRVGGHSRPIPHPGYPALPVSVFSIRVDAGTAEEAADLIRARLQARGRLDVCVLTLTHARY